MEYFLYAQSLSNDERPSTSRDIVRDYRMVSGKLRSFSFWMFHVLNMLYIGQSLLSNNFFLMSVYTNNSLQTVSFKDPNKM